MSIRDEFEKWLSRPERDFSKDNPYEKNSPLWIAYEGYQAASAHYEAERNALMAEFNLHKAAKLYDEAPDDAEFEPPHPIFKLAQERDNYAEQLRNAIAVIAQKDAALNHVLSEIEDGVYCYETEDGAYLGNAVNPECESVLNAKKALFIQPDNCRLVAVGKATSNEIEQWCIADLELKDGTHTLYTIVQEGVE